MFQIIAAALAAIALGLPPGEPRGNTSAPGGQDPAGCVRANVGGRLTCLAVRRVCGPRFEHIYEFYGLKCARVGQAYELRQRTSVGPLLPAR